MPHGPLSPHPLWAIPFALLLCLIAAGPLWFPGWWSRRYAVPPLILGSATILYYLLGLGATERTLDTAREYASFIILIGSLYVVSGGILVTVRGEATPRANVAFLALGAVLTNLLGTTGASMLLIRPWIRLNRYRITGHHIAFFIFIISNVGGCLTPIGDPPLFLGFLQGVPFWWVLRQCWPMWLVAVSALLAVFYVIDRRNYLRAPREVRDTLAAPADTWTFRGLHNLALLAVILGTVTIHQPAFLRESLMVAAAALSWWTTRREIHTANEFNFHPIREVAVLFAGIFATMMPALDLLQTNAAQWGPLTPATCYWGSGLLSSILDNAPTYLSFLSAVKGAFPTDPGQATSNLQLLLQNPDAARCLVAISVGSVFFGALTYIGNGPNFMVKAIADQQKVRTPTFVGYLLRHSLPVLFPILGVIWFLFFR